MSQFVPLTSLWGTFIGDTSKTDREWGQVGNIKVPSASIFSGRAEFSRRPPSDTPLHSDTGVGWSGIVYPAHFPSQYSYTFAV